MRRARASQLRSWVIVALCLGLAGPSKAVDGIEILSLSPPPPATLEGVVVGPPGAAGVRGTPENSVTVVVRYTSDGEATTIDAFSVPTTFGSVGVLLVPPTGSTAPCGDLRGTTSGECAVAFSMNCPAGSSEVVRFSTVAAALGIGDGLTTSLATDRSPGEYTFRCPGRVPPPARVSNCRVLGVAGVPGFSELPFGNDLPICRCLRDDGAREFRCGFLHPDFFLVRRVPLPPLLAGGMGSEEWSILPLTKLAGPVRLTLSGSGLDQPFQRVFGTDLAPGVIESFSVPLLVSPGTRALRGQGIVEYEARQGDEVQWRKFEFDRTLGREGEPPN
jgi:hypothetical protein